MNYNFISNFIDTFTIETRLLLLWAGALLIFIWLVYRLCYVPVADQQVAVIFRYQQEQIAIFLPTGRHLILPWVENFAGRLSTARQSTHGEIAIRARDGHKAAIIWLITYQLQPFDIAPGLRNAMADVLLTDPNKLVETQINACWQKVAERFTYENLQHKSRQKSENSALLRTLSGCLQPYGIQLTKLTFTVTQKPSRSCLHPTNLRHKTRPELPNETRQTNAGPTDTWDEHDDLQAYSGYDALVNNMYEPASLNGNILTGKLIA